MSRSYIRVSSITHAIKAKNVLDSNGIYARIVRNDKSNSKDSCGYAIVVQGNLKHAEDILVKNHIRISSLGDARGG